MRETSARLLRLLSLLQAKRFWRGADLAERVGITDRTLRRDMGRLRELGYPIEAMSGPHGGYALGAGGTLPPVLLDDDEAVAVAVGLRTAAGGTVVGLEEAAIAALAKLEQVLPKPLHARVAALSASTVELGVSPPGVDPGTLVAIAQACRGLERMRLDYVDWAERATERTVEPYRLVHAGRRWYLVARDVRVAEWRTFRVDRISNPIATGHRFSLTDPPDAAALVAHGVSIGAYRFRATVRVDAPPDEVAASVPRTVAQVEPADDGRATTMTLGGDTVAWLAAFLAALPFTFEALDPPELRAAVRDLGRRLAATHA